MIDYFFLHDLVEVFPAKTKLPNKNSQKSHKEDKQSNPKWEQVKHSILRVLVFSPSNTVIVVNTSLAPTRTLFTVIIIAVSKIIGRTTADTLPCIDHCEERTCEDTNTTLQKKIWNTAETLVVIGSCACLTCAFA